MLTYDFEPLYRTSVGFDTLIHVLESALDAGQAVDDYPPYDIESLDDGRYRVTLDVAGFAPDELEVQTQQNWLIVTGRKPPQERGREYFYRGLRADNFERRFQLADFVKVTGANLADGLLTIDLVRELPEALRPRRIEISAQMPGLVHKAKELLTGDKAA
jgi:molecular chaperone IbpA